VLRTADNATLRIGAAAKRGAMDGVQETLFEQLVQYSESARSAEQRIARVTTGRLRLR